jgi:hypothetical protein
MTADRIWPDDYTFGWASTPAPGPSPLRKRN